MLSVKYVTLFCDKSQNHDRILLFIMKPSFPTTNQVERIQSPAGKDWTLLSITQQVYEWPGQWMERELVKSNQRCQVAGPCQCSADKNTERSSQSVAMAWIKVEKFNNGKGCACPLEEALNCAVLEREELAKAKLSIHFFMHHLTNMYLMSTTRKGLPYRLGKQGKTWIKHDVCLQRA